MEREEGERERESGSERENERGRQSILPSTHLHRGVGVLLRFLHLLLERGDLLLESAHLHPGVLRELRGLCEGCLRLL